MKPIPTLLLLVSLYLTVLGLRLLAQPGFVEKLRKGTWKPTKNDVFLGKHGYNYDKYARGVSYLISGLIILVFGVLRFFA